MGMEIVFGLRLGFQIPMYTQLRISVGIAIQAQNFPSRDMGIKVSLHCSQQPILPVGKISQQVCETGVHG